MHVYFINYHKFEGSSGIHIHFLANELVKLGVDCTICLPQSKGTIPGCSQPLYNVSNFSELKRKIASDPKSFKREKAILHAWTPREVVRKCVASIIKKTSLPYFVHLEDNEEHILQSHTGVDATQVNFISRLRHLLIPKCFINPSRYREFIAKTSGVTCIIDTLKAFVPDSVPALTFWPACESVFYELPASPDQSVRLELGIPSDAITLTYTGNTHASNLSEVQTLYASVVALNKQGFNVRLLRCGGTHAKMDEGLTSEARPYVIELGSLPPEEFVKYVAAADILVQPGRPDHFNDYRFPSKIPMFLASGRPTILPATNIGKHLEDRENCLLLHKGTTEELVEKLTELILDEELRTQVGLAGRSFAKKRLDWAQSAKDLLAFYTETLRS